MPENVAPQAYGMAKEFKTKSLVDDLIKSTALEMELILSLYEAHAASISNIVDHILTKSAVFLIHFEDYDYHGDLFCDTLYNHEYDPSFEHLK